MIQAEKIRKKQIEFWKNATIEDIAKEILQIRYDEDSREITHITSDNKEFSACHFKDFDKIYLEALNHQIELLKKED